MCFVLTQCSVVDWCINIIINTYISETANNHHLKSVAYKVPRLERHSNRQSTMESSFIPCPKFVSCLVNLMIATYQPVCCCKDPSTFKEMCLSSNIKSPILRYDKPRNLISQDYVIAKKHDTGILKGKHFAFTIDGWTSLDNVGYVTCTAHFIDTTACKLRSMVLGLYEKDDRSRADNIFNYCEL